MLARTGLLIILALAAMLIAGCGGAKYENTAKVVSRLELHTKVTCYTIDSAIPTYGDNVKLSITTPPRVTN